MHLRSITSDNMEDSFSCKSILESSIAKANDTQNITNHIVRDNYYKYMSKLYNLGEKKKHQLKLDHPYEHDLELDLDVVPDKSRFAHIVNAKMSKALLKDELYKIHKTFVMLREAFVQYQKKRELNKSQLEHDGREKYKNITEFLKESIHYIGVDLNEVRNVMLALEISLPSDEEMELTFSQDELLLAREYMSVGKHVYEIYKIFSSKCLS